MAHEVLEGLGVLLGYYALAALVALLAKIVLHPPKEVMRKALHIICVMSVVPTFKIADSWIEAVLIALAFALLIFPLLSLAERLPIYQRILPERKGGEVKQSLIVVQLMFAVLTAVFWGLLGERWKYVIMVAVMAWGYGDAAAALIGKAFGRRKLKHRLLDGKKTLEGTLAMFIVSLLVIFVTTMDYAIAPWYLCLVIALLVAPVCAVVELFTSGGMDTITVPFSAAASLFVLVSILSALGGIRI